MPLTPEIAMTILKTLTCGTCAVEHAIPQVIYDHCRNEGGFWHCPNGHQRGWKNGANKTELENLRRERDRAIQDQARLAEENTEKEKEIARLKKRSAAGVCPCCTRTFTNMSRHMKTKHPEMIAENVVKLKKKIA